MSSDLTDQCTRIDTLQSDDVVSFKIRVQGFGLTIVAGEFAQFLYDKSLQEQASAFNVFGVDAVVSNEWISHRDDLASVRRIGQDFLITSHAGVENNLAVNFTISSESLSSEDFTVYQRQLSRATCHVSILPESARNITSVENTVEHGIYQSGRGGKSNCPKRRAVSRKSDDPKSCVLVSFFGWMLTILHS